MRLRSLPSVTLVFSLAVAHCGSTTSSPVEHDAGPKADAAPKADAGPTGHDAGPKSDAACQPATPASHVASASSCSTSRPPSKPGDAGAGDASLGMCTDDSQCTGGKNGRCMSFTGGGIAGSGCNYDECFTGSDCASDSICVCGTPTSGQGRTSNACLPSNCESDSDCGEGGFCSPTFDTSCGAFAGVVGYYCHKPANECTVDECVNDSDCNSELGQGWCAWSASSSKWACFYGECAG